MSLDEMGNYKPYPAYKDSGVKWLGNIPAQWQAKRLKHLCSRSALYGANLSASEYIQDGVRFLRTTDITDDGHLVSDGAVYVPEDQVKEYLLEDRDLLLSRSGTLGRSLHYEADIHGLCAYAGYLVRFVPTQDFDPQFAFYYTKSKSFEQWLLASTISSTIGNVNGQKYANLELPTPPLLEQQAIGRFLDHKTSEIDALIAAKERLITLLQEKRAALITHAVTKGLDPTVLMKDSGIEWLGRIPAHWEIKPLKFMSTLQTGLTLGKSHADSVHLVSRPYLRVANVQDGYLDLDEITYIDMPAKDVSRYELRADDVVVTEGGDFDKLGRGYVWQEQIKGCLHQNHIFAVRTSSNALEPHFLAAVTASGYGRAYFTATSKQSTNLASTNSRKLMNFPVALPDIPEQQAILRFIGEATAELDNTTAKVREGIECLQEYRTALISSAVTGKIDVRNAT